MIENKIKINEEFFKYYIHQALRHNDFRKDIAYQKALEKLARVVELNLKHQQEPS